MKYIAETEKDNEALNILSAFILDKSKLVKREDAFAVTMATEAGFVAALKRHDVYKKMSEISTISALKEAEPQLVAALSKVTDDFLDTLAASMKGKWPWSESFICEQAVKITCGRFEECHIWEPGDKLETFPDEGELLVKVSTVKALIEEHSKTCCRVIAAEDLKLMVGQRVFIMAKKHPSDASMQPDGWIVLPAPLYDNPFGVYECSFLMGKNRFLRDYGVTWLAYTQPPKEAFK